MMTERERFLAIIHHQPTDRPWRFETIGFWPETLERWKHEGLPAYAANIATSQLYFGFDHWLPILIGADGGPGFFPPFMPKVLKRTKRYEIVRDPAGNINRQFRDGSAAIPQHIGSPVENMDDFRAVSWRLEPNFPGRCDNVVWNSVINIAKHRDAPVVVMVSGPFAFHRHLMGVEKLMYAYFDQPELIHEMSRQWMRLTIGAIRNISQRTQISGINFWEDMCYKNGPIISPRTFREFCTPYYKQAIDDAKEQGVEGFMVDTDGDCNILIPLFIEVGVNFMYPFEVQAGMDVRKVREQYGDKLAIMGGIDKLVLERSQEEIETEVDSKVPEMLRSGGYIPGLDHAVHPDVPYENFKFYLKLMREKYGRG